MISLFDVWTKSLTRFFLLAIRLAVGSLSDPAEVGGLYRQLSILPDGQTQGELTRPQSLPALLSSVFRAVVLRSLNFPLKTRMVMLCVAAGLLV